MPFDRAALPPMDVAGRAPRLRERLGDIRCAALLVTNPTNIRYLTGFTGTNGACLVGAEPVPRRLADLLPDAFHLDG